MSSISASSLFSNDNTNAKRVTGLASGMDVDELVDSLSVKTQGKINKIKQNIQKNEWKTDAYRNLISKLTSFSDKYLSFASKDNMLSSASYSSYSVKANGSAADYLKVSTTSAAGAQAAANMVIRGVSSVASAAHYSTGAVTKAEFTASDAIAAEFETNNIKGQSIGFKLNDGSNVTYTFKSDNAADAVAELNEAFKDSGVKAEYKDGSLEITAEGDNKLAFTGVSGKIKDIFGIDTSTAVDSSNAFSYAVDESKVTSSNSVIDTVAGKTMTFNYNGISKKVTIDKGYIDEYLASSETAGKTADENTAAATAYALQKGLDKAYGAGRINASVTADNKLSFSTASSTNTFSITEADGEVKTALGVKTGSSNRLTNSAISSVEFANQLTAQDEYKMKINDVELTFTKDDTVNSIMSKINNSGAGVTVSYSQTSNTFSFVANETGSQGRIEVEDVSGNLAAAMFGGNITSNNGTDTVMDVSFDGGNTFQEVTRSTASVNLDGVSISLDKDITAADFTKPVSFVANNDTDKIVDKIKSMINEYNDIIKEVNDAVKTRPDSEYQPLTEAQKKEMTEEQIEQWEKKAKTGILYGEREIQDLAYELSNAVTSVVNGVGIPSSIGISLSSDYNKGGIIEIDEDKLKEAVEKDADKVIGMFTNDNGSSTGILERTKDVLDKYVGTKIQSDRYSRSRGILVNMAGIKDHLSETDNNLNDSLKALKEELTKMEERYDSEREKLFNKFSYLESFISQQNSTASWISAQLGL